MKTYKKGTKVMLFATCNFVGCDSEEEYELECDMTESELFQLAEEFALEHVQPEGYFEVVEEIND